jgi:hypothetical protein
MEPNYFLQNIVALLLPFGCYYLGILIRKVVIPGKESPPLVHQCLLGIPVSLVVVSPLLPVLGKLISDVPGLCVTLGIIIEHGMLVNETATQHLSKLGKPAA